MEYSESVIKSKGRASMDAYKPEEEEEEEDYRDPEYGGNEAELEKQSGGDPRQGVSKLFSPTNAYPTRIKNIADNIELHRENGDLGGLKTLYEHLTNLADDLAEMVNPGMSTAVLQKAELSVNAAKEYISTHKHPGKRKEKQYLRIASDALSESQTVYLRLQRLNDDALTIPDLNKITFGQYISREESDELENYKNTAGQRSSDEARDFQTGVQRALRTASVATLDVRTATPYDLLSNGYNILRSNPGDVAVGNVDINPFVGMVSENARRLMMTLHQETAHNDIDAEKDVHRLLTMVEELRSSCDGYLMQPGPKFTTTGKNSRAGVLAIQRFCTLMQSSSGGADFRSVVAGFMHHTSRGPDQEGKEESQKVDLDAPETYYEIVMKYLTPDGFVAIH